jgi:CxxC motif-containing protein (DUF1111 family)
MRTALRTFAYSAFAAAVPLGVGVAVRAGDAAPDDVSPKIAELAKTVSLEPGEDSPGGSATTKRSMVNRDAFSQPSQGLSFEAESRFQLGNALFRKLWVSAPATTDSSDGLGPLYNARGCQNCHLKDGRGRPPADAAEESVSMFLRLSIPPQTDDQNNDLATGRISAVPEPTYGIQLQNFAVQGLDREGRMEITYSDVPVTFKDGTTVTLRKPTYAVSGLKYGPLHKDVMLSPRIAPQMIGLGLLHAIPDADIRAKADPDDANDDGISGRARETWSIEAAKPVLGRFGWKGGTPNVRQQSAEAFHTDMGLSTPLYPQNSGECTSNQKICLDAPNGASARHSGYEVGPELFDLVVFYAQNLAVPPRRTPGRSDVLAGKAIFTQLNCQGCHTPSHQTGEVPGQPHLSNQKIWPYTDLLLHDMGEGLADNRPEGNAHGREWRTPPLWGIGLTQAVSRHTFFLHDGRARNLEEAILWHGGEAQASRDGYLALSSDERDALLAFVRSL